MQVKRKIVFKKSFNPRARGGRDQKDEVIALQAGVSIHAPAGGATIRTTKRRLR